MVVPTEKEDRSKVREDRRKKKIKGEMGVGS